MTERVLRTDSRAYPAGAGGSIEVEPGGAEDIRIDFAARFPDWAVDVEAVAPAFNVEVGEQVKQRNPLLDIVEAMAPPDLWVLVGSLPELGPSDSKKPFKRAVERLLGDAAGGDVSVPTELSEELPQGTLRIKVRSCTLSAPWRRPSRRVADPRAENLRRQAVGDF